MKRPQTKFRADTMTPPLSY